MSGLPPGDPQLVSMIVNHLKTQGLFDQFRRDCLADVDTKPAYLNLKQRVDNFVSNHLSNHTWSPHLNKNQLRNNIRQLVLQSGMLEQGVDRIVTQVVDPKINHIFRPQVERVVREFLSPGSCSQEPPAPLPPAETKPDSNIPEQASLSTPTTTAASDAMSILDTITSLNQEASVRASSVTEKGPKGQAPDDIVQLVEENVQDMNIVDDGDSNQDGKLLDEADDAKVTAEDQASEAKTENAQEQMELDKEGSLDENKMEEEESGAHEQTEEEKDRCTSKISGKPSEEKQDDDDDDDALKSTSQAKQKARERIKEEYSLEDSDLDGLSDITVSSVHTSDLSSFEEESDEEEQLSDSSEEGELPPDDQCERVEKKHTSGDTGDEDKEPKPRRKAYVHKPFLYSRYYSDSDDEITVEERRRSAAKEKEERLLKRQQNRERMEEKRKQKATQAEEQDHQKQKSADSASLECPKAKEARKERKVLEKKMALNRKRKLDSRKGEVLSKKKGNVGDITKKAELKSFCSKTPQPKLMRNLSESTSSDEKHRRMSGSISEDSSDARKVSDKGRTHSFILDLEQGSQEALKQRSFGKFDRLSRKELHSKDRKDNERSLSNERTKLRQKQERKSEHQSDESQMKEGTAVKVSSEEKGEKKPKIKSEKKMAASTREGKVAEGVPDEGGSKDTKKVKVVSGETVKADKEKDKTREKDKIKEKEKTKAEKSSVKSDFKQLLRPDSAGSSEDRSDMEPGSDGTKKREKNPKEVLKRSKSHTEDRSGDKSKSKTDSEKEKTKADQDSQKLQKSSSETDKDPKRVKTTEKGKVTEKTKLKSKEGAKIPLSLKTDKKVQISDVKSAAGASIIKPEATKEKRKDGNIKEQRRITEETSHEKSDLKSSKKKQEKKDKVPEKKDDGQEEKTTKEGKPEKFDKSKSVSLCLETEEPPKKQTLPQETSTDSDPVTTTVTTSFSDDTCDALSDITPEPPEGEPESRLGEIPAVLAENDALLTLMDVCTSAEAKLPPECLREEAALKTELQDADMKMKEAALTLLSMDPDSTVSPSLICQDTRDEALLYPPDTKQVEATMAEEEVLSPVQVQLTYESELSVSETSLASCQQPVELVEKNPDNTGESENLERKMETTENETTEMIAPQIKVDDVALNICQISLKEEATKSIETPPETELDEKMTVLIDQEVTGAVKSGPEETRGSTEVSTAAFSDTTEQVSEIPSKPVQTESDFEVRRTNLKAVETEEEANQTQTGVDKEEVERKNAEENVAEEGDLQTMETSIPDTTEEVEAESASKLIKQMINISSTESQEDEKSSDLSEKEEKKDERGRCKRKLSCQTDDKKDEREDKEQLSAEETEMEVVEARTPRRGRSSRTAEEAEKDQAKEPEKSEEPLNLRRRLSGAAAQETAVDYEKKDENRTEDIPDETSSLKAAEKEEKGEDESKPNQTLQSGIEDNPPSPVPEGSEGAGSSDLPDIMDTCKPTLKRKRSEEMEESREETQVQEETKDSRGQDQSTEQLEKDNGCCPSTSQSDVKEVCSENKPDDAKEEQHEEQHEDQEAAPKRRRGRPPKAAVMEDLDKKDKKADEKDIEQNDDEEEEEDEKDGEGKETSTRATTRLASRLEAEKNKPSKPSTRASRQNGKEETTAGTRGARGQAASKGGRKREASPPAGRTRGGQKSEELPSKRAKR